MVTFGVFLLHDRAPAMLLPATAGSGGRPPFCDEGPELLLTDTDELKVELASSTPPVFLLIEVDPAIELAAQPLPVPPPMKTNPVLLLTESELSKVALHSVNATAPVELTLPTIVPPFTSKPPPVLTVTEPFTLPVMSTN